MSADRLERYADLTLKVGVNLQREQPLMTYEERRLLSSARADSVRRWEDEVEQVLVRRRVDAIVDAI